MTIVVTIPSPNFAKRFAKKAIQLGGVCGAIHEWERGVFARPITGKTKAIYDSKIKFWTVDNSFKTNAEIIKEIKEGTYL